MSDMSDMSGMSDMSELSDMSDMSDTSDMSDMSPNLWQQTAQVRESPLMIPFGKKKKNKRLQTIMEAR